MKLSDIIKKFGDLEITGLEHDEMLNAKDVKAIMHKDPYPIITKLKSHYGLQYDECCIPKSKLYKYYGLGGNQYE